MKIYIIYVGYLKKWNVLKENIRKMIKKNKINSRLSEMCPRYGGYFRKKGTLYLNKI